MENLVSTKDIIGGKKWLDNIALLFNQLILCRKESGAGEGDHVPGLTRVHVTAAEYGFLAFAVKNSRASHSKVKAGLIREICTPQTECGPSQKGRAAQSVGVVSFSVLGNFIR